MSKFSEYIRLYCILPIAEKIKGTNASYWYKQINTMASWNRQQIVAWQNQQLKDFIQHAYNHTTYYHNLFDSLGLKPEDIQCAEDLKKLPIITKDIIRQHYDEIVPDNIDTMKYRKDKTGGTTGSPMKYLTHEDVWGYVTASKIYSWKKMGYRYGDKFAALGSSSLFNKKASLTRRIYDWIRQEVGMNSLNLSDDLCANYLERMRKSDIHYVYGYASAVYLMAKYVYNHQLDVSFIWGVFTTSENLIDSYRQMIENAFHCRVMDCYGARDAGVTAFEILPKKYFVSYDVIPEVIDEFAPDSGKFITTCFLNYAFPLIRYEFGDMVHLENNTEYYNGAILTEIYGRISDVLHLDNGHVLTSPGYTILMNQFDVVAYDIQKISGRKIKMKIQPIQGKWNKEQEAKLAIEMQRYVGDSCCFSIEYVDGFEELPNGKRRYFMNDISQHPVE